MKVKKYNVKLISANTEHTIQVARCSDVTFFIESLDTLWRFIDFDEWGLEIWPSWEEVSEDA